MLWSRSHSPLERELARASLTLSTSLSPVPWTHTTLSRVWEGKLKNFELEIFFLKFVVKMIKFAKYVLHEVFWREL